jgi:hypothetical protein
MNVLALYAINHSRTAAALLTMENGKVPLMSPGRGAGGSKWFQIESTHFDCVTNILDVLSNAKSTQQSIVVTLDDNDKIIEAFEWTDTKHSGGRNMTQNEINLANEGNLGKLATTGAILLDNDE